MTLPAVNTNAPWVDVNLTWDARPWHDPEFIARQDQAITAQAAAEAAWAAAIETYQGGRGWCLVTASTEGPVIQRGDIPDLIAALQASLEA